MVYVAKYLKPTGDTYGTDYFNVENDEAAVAYVHDEMRLWIGRRHEIWQDERLVHEGKP
jgi:hypothetical protein